MLQEASILCPKCGGRVFIFEPMFDCDWYVSCENECCTIKCNPDKGPGYAEKAYVEEVVKFL